METKRISVCIPAYNAEDYIAETLHSIRLQTLYPLEVLVYNDGSTDSTISILDKHRKILPYNLRIINNSENLGIGFARQQLIEHVKGDYIAFLSADDCYEPKFIESSSKYLDPTTATYTHYYRCNQNLISKESFYAPEGHRINIIHWALKKNMFINFSSTIIPIMYLERIPFEPELRHGEDLIWLLDSLSYNLRWRLVPEFLLSYRIHAQQGTNLQTHRQGEEFELLWKHLKQRLKVLGVPYNQIESAYRQSQKRANPPLWRILAARVYHKVKGV